MISMTVLITFLTIHQVQCWPAQSAEIPISSSVNPLSSDLSGMVHPPPPQLPWNPKPTHIPILPRLPPWRPPCKPNPTPPPIWRPRVPIPRFPSLPLPDPVVEVSKDVEAPYPAHLQPEAFIHISSSDDVDHSTSRQGIARAIRRGTTNFNNEVIGKKVEEAAMEVQKAIPSATIIVKKKSMVLQDKGREATVILFTDNNDIVTSVWVLVKRIPKKKLIIVCLCFKGMEK
ncbi:uncharacterized protein LOC129318756 [Prosopis cineraria]|uniref:uncharacterized protein LOC129318756 n=1 Tax=Prosopis cineraria TaxID=364024 RepID=UPI002410369C|nr:uncharacterized protein LOC129318756 [Prosopis cineraria]